MLHFIVSLSALVLSTIAFTTTEDLVIETQYGSIKGYTNGMVNIWSSIPYASPPIGNLRFAPPEPVEPWNSTLNTMDDPPGCMQVCTFSWWACPMFIQEDCLFLNIFTSLNAQKNNSSLKPVMAFIHGGDYVFGYAGSLIYNATYFVNQTDVIVVAFNYRLGAFGFLFDSTTNLTGNYGYFDQVLALEWIYDNIQAFGGDPNQITIYGESAGGVSVGVLLLNTSNTIIKAAIMESNPYGQPLRTVNTWGELPNLFKYYADCNILVSGVSQLECLLTTSADKLLEAQLKAQMSVVVELKWFAYIFMPWTPTIGTGVINEQPLFAMQESKNYLHVPIIMGVNRNEGTLFIWEAFSSPLTKIEYELFVPLAFDNLIDAVLVVEYYSSYNVSNQSDYRPLMAQITTDAFFRCPVRNVSNAIASDSDSLAVYMYHFNHVSSFASKTYPNDQECWNVVCHASELAYVFQPDLIIAGGNYTQEEWQLARTFGYYWSSMASDGHTPGDGNPNSNVDWLPFGSQQNTIMLNTESDGGVQIESFYDAEVCDFWDTLQYNWMPQT